MPKQMEQDSSQSSESTNKDNEAPTQGEEGAPSSAPRRGPQVQLAPEMLDQAGEGLSVLVAGALAMHDPVMGVAVDQVEVEVPIQNLEAAALVLRDNVKLRFNYFRCLATVDYQEYLELVYLLYSTEYRYQIMFKSRVPYTEGGASTATVPSLRKIWPAADWHERESHDLFGVFFSGHPNMEPLLLYDEFEGFPGLKSFPFNEYEDW